MMPRRGGLKQVHFTIMWVSNWWWIQLACLPSFEVIQVAKLPSNLNEAGYSKMDG